MEREEVNPSSPGVSPVQLSDCLEELVKFVIESSINATTHGADLGISADFCAALLSDHLDSNHDDPPISTDFSEGVPLYPLYKHLASALQHWIMSGSFFSARETVLPISEDESMEELRDKWNDLVSQKGSELVNLLKSISFELHVQEPYFTQLKDGLKTIEGRCAVGNYSRIRAGDFLFFNNCLMLKVQEIRHHASFLEMLEAESLEKVLPGVLTIEEGEQIYRKFYSKEKEQLNGVLAICVGKPPAQPYNVLSDIISGLGYKGIQSLLGFKQTIGTIPEALPPPRSSLLSSFTSPYKPNVAP